MTESCDEALNTRYMCKFRKQQKRATDCTDAFRNRYEKSKTENRKDKFLTRYNWEESVRDIQLNNEEPLAIKYCITNCT